MTKQAGTEVDTGPSARRFDQQILYLVGHEVQQACAQLDPVAIVEEVLILHATGQTTLPPEAYLAWSAPAGGPARSLNMPGRVGGRFNAVGTKIINGNPENVRRGMSRASGLTLLFDVDTARVVCVMEGSYISALRTASVTALATRVLGPESIGCLAILGAGALARAHLHLLPERLPALRQVMVFDTDWDKACSLADEYRPGLRRRGASIEAVSNARRAVESAELIVTVTTTTTGYIAYSWLRPGALLANVSLDDPLPEVILNADRVFVDDWGLVASDTRRLLGRMYHAHQVCGPDDESLDGSAVRRVDGELGSALVGVVAGRTSPGERIVFNPFGLAIEDVAVASEVYRVAVETGLGTRLEV